MRPIFLFFFLFPAFLSASVYHRDLTEEEKRESSFVWEHVCEQSFDELFLSWNGRRPERGEWKFWVCLLLQGRWTAPMPYAYWGSPGIPEKK